MRCLKFLTLVALSCGPILAAQALPEDSDQPINIQANTATLDDRRNTAVYTGDVIVTQGSMQLTGDRVTLNTDAEGSVTKVISVGNPATFVQTPQPGEAPINARAQTIEYFAAEERVVLIDNAYLDQDGDTFQGQYVQYDVARQVVEAGRAAEDSASQQRIEMTIQPRKNNERSAP